VERIFDLVDGKAKHELISYETEECQIKQRTKDILDDWIHRVQMSTIRSRRNL